METFLFDVMANVTVVGTGPVMLGYCCSVLLTCWVAVEQALGIF